MLDARSHLVVDEGLYLQATKTLGDLEGGDEPYELLNAVGDFSGEAYLAARFESEVGRELAVPEKRAIDNYIAGIFLPNHHNLYFEGILDSAEEFEGLAWDFIRNAAWAFLVAWTQRYGGLHQRLCDGGTLVDPDVGHPADSPAVS